MPEFKSLDHAIDILFSFTEENLSLPAEEIANRVGLPRVSVYRYLNTLVERGLLEKNRENGKYGLGYKLLYFQSLIHRHSILEKIAFPIMECISREIGETVHLSVYKDGKGIIVEAIESSAPVRVAPPVGGALPFNGGSTVEAMIAFLPEEDIEEICSSEFASFTESTILDKSLYMNKLEIIRKNGYAFSLEEVHPGAWGVAAPIFDKKDCPIASLGISGPIFRYNEELKKLSIENVLKYSREITEEFNLRQKNRSFR